MWNRRSSKEFLQKKSIISSATTYLDPAKKGVFFTDLVTKNASAVMVRFASGCVYFLPNSFV
jgi:hypothetical protein